MNQLESPPDVVSQTIPKSSIAPWARPLLILPAMILVIGLCQLTGSWLMGLDPNMPNGSKSLFQEVIDSLFSLLGMIAVVRIFRSKIDRESFQSMGFYPKGFVSEWVTGLSLGALLMAAGFVTLIFLQQIQWTNTILDVNSLLLSFVLFLSVAFFEELFLRGYVLNNLMKSMHPMIALLVSALVFALLHVFNDNFSWLAFWSILLAGILLGLPYIHTKSLWLPIALHLSWNFFQGPVFGFSVSGVQTSSLVIQSRSSDNVINGGPFGFEASVICIVLQVIAIGGLGWYYRERSKKIMENVLPESVCQVQTLVNNAD